MSQPFGFLHTAGECQVFQGVSELRLGGSFLEDSTSLTSHPDVSHLQADQRLLIECREVFPLEIGHRRDWIETYPTKCELRAFIAHLENSPVRPIMHLSLDAMALVLSNT